MLRLTARAAATFATIRADWGLGREAGLRLRPDRHGIGMAFCRLPEPGDAVIDAEEIKIYVARELTVALEGSTIDVDGGGRARDFILRAPRLDASP